MATRNVDLLIRAKEQASNAFKAVSEALNELDNIQADATKSAGKLDAALARGGTAAKGAAEAINRDLAENVDRVNTAYDRVAQTVEKATNQLSRQESELTESREAYKALQRQAEAAAQAIERAEGRVGPRTPEELSRLEAMKTAYRDLNVEIGKATPRLERAEIKFSENAKELDRVRNGALAATAALREIERATEAAADAAERQARSRSEVTAINQAARRGLTELSKAEARIQGEIAERARAEQDAAQAKVRANENARRGLAILAGAERDVARAVRARKAEEARAVNTQAGEGIRALAAAEERAKQAVIERAEATSLAREEFRRGNANAKKGLAELLAAEKWVGAQTEENARIREKADAAMQQSIRDLIASENRLTAIRERQARIEDARAVNTNARNGLAGITAGLTTKARADEAAARATTAHQRAMDALNASYAKQRAAARVSAAEQTRLAGSSRQAYAAAQQASSPIGGLYKEVVRLGPASQSAAGGVQRLTGQMSNGRQVFRAFYGDSRRALSLMQRIRGEVLSLTASFVGFYGVFNVGRGVLESFQQLEAAQNRLGAAFNQDYAAVQAEMAQLNAEASRLGISFDTLAGTYSNFIISGQQAGLETEKLRTIFRQVAEAGRVLKLSNDQIEGTFNALIQIAGKGTLQMEELRQQLGDRLPGAVGLVAKALGYADDELAQFYKDVTDGAVSAEAALVALGQGLEEQYGGQLEQALDSVATKIGALQNLLFQRQLTAANSGFISGLETALEALNAWLASREGIEFFEAMGAAFGRMFELLPPVLEHVDRLVTLFQAFVAIKVGQVVSGLGTQFTALAGLTVRNVRVQVALNRVVAAYSPAAASALRSTTLLGAGLRGLRRVMAGLIVSFRALIASVGGPIGILAAALSLFAIQGIASVDDGMQDLNRTMEDAEQAIGQVAQAFRDAGGDADAFKRKLEGINELDLELGVRALREQLNSQTNGNRDSVSGIITQVRTLEQAINRTVTDSRARAYFLRLTHLFDQGQISAGELREGINDLAAQFGEVSEVSGLDDFLEWLDALADAEDKIARLEAELAVIEGTASDAQKELLGLATSTDEAAEKAKAAQERMDVFEQAMRSLGENIPSLNDKLKELDALREIEQDFEDAIKAADAFTDATKRAAAAASAVDLRNQAYREFYAGQVSGYSGSDGLEVTAQFIRDQEAFRSGAYYDVNAYRAGYGSDTVTRQDGTVQAVTQATTVTIAEANRDLYRRITEEFIPSVVATTGEDRFASFNAQQQAALVSIAYNYGEIPARIAEAVRSGTSEEVADAIRSLAGDNGGINKARRGREAALFTSTAGVETQEQEYLAGREEARKAAEKQAEAQAEFNLGLDEQIAKEDFLTSIEGQRLVDRQVAIALREAENEAAQVGLTLTEEQRAEIERTTRAKYASEQADQDREASLQRARDLEAEANLLVQERELIKSRIAIAEQNGEASQVATLGEELEAVDAQLEDAIAKAIVFWEAIGGDGSKAAILALQQTQVELGNTGNTGQSVGQQLSEQFAGHATDAISQFLESVASGEPVWQSFGNTVAQMAANILIQLGQMILRALILRAVMSALGIPVAATGGADLGQQIVGALVAHSGTVVGPGSLRSSRRVNPAVFANATKYHSGGIAGFAPDEYPAILKEGEEVLTEMDPRHRFNGGGSSGESGRAMTIINAFDAEDALERGLGSARGEEVFVNTVRAKKSEIKAILG